MLKFIVVLHRRPDLTAAEFRRHLEQVHGPLAKVLPGLKMYIQNYPVADPKRSLPSWDAVVELYFANRDEMEAAWASPQGAASDADLPLFAHMTQTTWSVVEEVTLLRSPSM